MERILILMDNKQDRRLVEEALEKEYHIWPETEHPLAQSFELAMIDGPSLKGRPSQIRAHGEIE